MPFAGYENFAACVLDQVKKGHSEESARRICGKLQAEAEGEMSEEKTPLRSVLLDAMPTADGAGLVEIPIAVTGKWKQGTREFEITREDLGKMVANFEKRQNREINVDYDHASEMTEVARGGPVPSAGAILKMRSNGALYAGIEFTVRALELIRRREYRYVSPAIDWSATDKITGEPQGTTLTSLALTNRPFLEELPAIKLSEMTGLATRDSGLGKKPETPAPNPEARIEGGTHMELSTKVIGKGKVEIFGDGKTLGFVELPSPESRVPSPEESFALFTERLGVKGKTEEQIKQLVESGVKFTGRETQDAAFKLLATECIKDGKLDRENMKVLARDQKATVEQFFTFEDAWGKVDAAVKAGKVLPKSREHALRIALSDAPAFDALMADAKPIVPLKATGLAGEGVSGTAVKVNPAPGIEVDAHSVKLNDRAEQIAVERKISFGEALKIARDELGSAAS